MYRGETLIATESFPSIKLGDSQKAVPPASGTTQALRSPVAPAAAGV